MAMPACESAVQVKTSRCVVDLLQGSIVIIDQIAEEWRELCARSVDDQPFYRPEWIRAHLRAFKPDASVLILTVRIAGELCFLLPLVEEKQIFSGLPIRKLRAPVNAHGGRFDAIRSQGPGGDISIGAAWDYLKQLSGWDLLEFRHIPAEST